MFIKYKVAQKLWIFQMSYKKPCVRDVHDLVLKYHGVIKYFSGKFLVVEICYFLYHFILDI